jgi:GNAT superfamily N-acetyltransferase
MDYSIRPAVREDAKAILRLSTEFADWIRTLGGPHESHFNVASYLRDGFGPAPAFSGLVADSGAEILGYVLYHEGYDVDEAARTLNLIDLYVREDARRIGVGGSLIREAGNVCRQIGGSQLYWSVYEFNQPAFEFYEKLGASYLNEQKIMYLDI